MKTIILSIILTLTISTFSNAQPAPQTLDMAVSTHANLATPPTFTCQNGVPKTATIKDTYWFDNRNNNQQMSQKTFVLEQLIPSMVPDIDPLTGLPRIDPVTGLPLEKVALIWTVKGYTQQLQGHGAHTEDVSTIDLDHNNTFDCIIRARGLHRDYTGHVNGVNTFGPWKVGVTGVSWRLQCGGAGGNNPMTPTNITPPTPPGN